MLKRRWRKKGKRVIAIDLYCGMGGATQGMLDAGAEVVMTCDGWEVAEFLHKANYPKVPFENRWLGKEPAADLAWLKAILSAYKGLDVHFHIHGSPPCQAFSTAGHKRPIEEGKENVDHFLWLVDKLKDAGMCDSWSMENVPATKNHYSHLPYHMMVASDYGAPQARKRWFAGEGWTPVKVKNSLSWNEALQDTTIPHGSVLNTVGAAWSNSHRARSSDSPWDRPSRTITRQVPAIRKENPDGTFTKVRTLTMNDIAVLQGFPSGLDLRTPTDQRDLTLALGNCVCPQAMSAVIRGIHWP